MDADGAVIARVMKQQQYRTTAGGAGVTKEGASWIHTTIYYFAMYLVNEKGMERDTTAADRGTQQTKTLHIEQNNGEGVKKFIRELILLYVL